MTVSASEVKTKGVSLFDKLCSAFEEVVISVRGKDKYVVLPFEEYEQYRAYKLEKAYKEVMQDKKNAKTHTDMQSHLDKIEAELE